ncbi:MAG: phosphoserine aminotransferase [Glaciecola sp.]|jgi:phosphoserine aminotransferase
MKVHNFSAGPCILPKEVMAKAAEAVVEYNNSGLSIIEMSHRSKDFIEVMDKAVGLVRDILEVPSGYEILFLQGGASLQFSMVVQNLLPINGKSAYINTGTWASKAIKEAKMFGEVEVVASSKDKNFSYIPKNIKVGNDTAYLHFTSNNTISGSQFKEYPKVQVPLVVDMSSDIFSKKINVADFDLIYAGAQKNIGPAGATLVIVKKSVLGKTSRIIPSMLDYKNHADKESMFNTPPCFSIFVCMLNLEWLKTKGLGTIEKENNEKAALLYAEIDRNPLFEGPVNTEDRSVMNPTFVLKNDSLNAGFLALAQQKGLNGIKGHRSVGGFRASMYNALPLSSVQVLVDTMKEFEKLN